MSACHPVDSDLGVTHSAAQDNDKDIGRPGVMLSFTTPSLGGT